MQSRFLFTFLMLIIVTFETMAESKPAAFQITGQAVEAKNGKGVPYITLTLQTDSGKLVKKLSSDASGKFSILVKEKRKYNLILSAMGYKEVKMAVEMTTDKTDLGKINVEEGVELKGVTVTAQKPLVRADVDKITYSIEADPDAQTNNGLEMLRKVPLLNVDADENITLNGQSNYKVLVNGKSSSMMSKNFKEVIKSLPANSIKEIEVITNPSSKYDAEGIGGIINIITMKKTLNGYNGSVSGGFDSYGSFNSGVYLSSKVEKFSFSGRLSVNQNRRPDNKYTSYRENYLSDDQYFTRQSGGGSSSGLSKSFSGEASYDIDSLNLLSLSFWGYSGNNSNNGNGATSIQNKAGVDTRLYNSVSNGKSSYGTLSGSVDYQKTYKKPDKSFTVSYKLDNNPNTSDNYNRIDSILNYRPYYQHSQNDAFSREQTLQVDYYDPLSKMNQIECGAKAIYRQNESNSNNYLYDYASQIWNRNDTMSNELDYSQYIVGAYAGYVCKLKSLTMKGGLRAELTWNDAVSKSRRDTSFSSHLQNVVPYVTFSYQLKPGKTIKLSYTQRLYRPGIWYLNPYVDNTNRQDIRYGNPGLKSEISHSFELGYNTFTPKINLGASASTSFTNNSIESVTSINKDNIRETTYKNIGTDLRSGLNLYFSYRPTPKYSFSLNSGGEYVKMETNNGYQISNEGFTYRGNGNIRLVLWKEGSVSFNGGIFSSGIQLQGRSGTHVYNSFGVSQYFFKKKMSLNLSVSDPFNKYRIYSSSNVDKYYISNNEFRYQSRQFRFSISYNFGKMDVSVKKAKRGISNDDVKSSGASN